MSISAQRFLASLYALWLLSLLVVFWFTAEAGTLLEAAFLSAIIPLTAHTALATNPTPPQRGSPELFALLLFLSILFSILFNTIDEYSLIYLLNIALALLVALKLSRDPSLLILIAKLYAVGGMFLLLAALQTDDYSLDGRFLGGLHPNWWGNVAVGIGITGLAHQNRLIKYPVVSIAFYMAFVCQSRGSLLALSAGVGVYFLVWLHQRKLLSKAFAGALIFIPIVLILLTFNDAFVDFFNTSVLLTDDPNRGLGSGFSGRADIWQNGIEMWESAPVFGIGYKTFSFGHNTMLMMLVETGLFGFCTWIAFFMKSALTSLRALPSLPALVSLAYIMAYTASGLTHPTSININPTSLLYLIIGISALRLTQSNPSNG